MKYIKTFEARKKDNMITLINLDDDSEIIKVTQEELDDLIEDDFTILYYDEEIGYDPEHIDEWRYDSDEEDDITDALISYRSMIKIYALGSRKRIRITKEELNALIEEDFDILYDDEEIAHDPSLPNEWRYDDDQEEQMMKWLELYRILKDPEKVNQTLKFNL